MAKPLGFPNAPKMSGGIARQIREACAVLKTKQDWIDLFTEYRHSKWLRGEANSASSRKRDFSWIFQRENNGSTENYVKIHNGRYRDRHEDDMDPLTRRNFEAAEQALNRMGIPTKAQTFILKGIADGRTVQDGNSGIPGEVGDGLWTDAEYCEDRDLPGGPGGVYAGAGADGDYLGQEESREIPDDRGFEDSDRGE